MSSVTLSEEQWRKILPFLLAHPKLYVGPQWSCRRFLSAVLWVSRSGAQWRLLPKEYGNWNSVYKRFSRWCEQGIWEGLHQHCASDPDLEHLIIDSTVIRAHPCAAGALNKSTAGKKPKH